MVFAGPNGSGKTTITRMAKTVGVYINADDIKKSSLCSDLEAAQKAEELRRSMLEKGEDFTFETVLSTDRNILLKKIRYFLKANDYSQNKRNYISKCSYQNLEQILFILIKGCSPKPIFQKIAFDEHPQILFLLLLFYSFILYFILLFKFLFK